MKPALVITLLVACLMLMAKSQSPAITAYTLSGSLAYDVFWVANSQIAFLLTNNGNTHQLYRSEDEGAHWFAQQLPNSAACYVVRIYADIINPQKLVFLGPPESSCGWNTLDAGKTYSYIEVPALQYLSFNVNMTGWIIGRTADSRAYYTDNLGTNWYQIENATYAAWAPRPVYENTTAWGAMFLLTTGGEFGFTYDQGNFFTPLWTNIMELHTTSNFVYALAQNRTLVVGQDEENLQFAYFPFGETVPYMYSVSDDSSGATWFFTDASAYWGNIYTAGASGALYVDSLQHVLKRDDAFLDFHSVYGLPGVHLANVVVNFNDNHDLRLKTYITFDNGGEWSALPAPTQVCADCSLNLYFNKVGQRPYYSSSHTIGLILANGYVGTSLSYDNPISLTPYLSRDAGLTWQPIKGLPNTGPYVFEFGKNGGILVMAQQNQATNTIYYSFDQGATMKSFTLSATVWVTRIVSDASGSSSVFGLFTINSVGNGAVYGLDFSTIQPSATCGTNDYENWSPSDGSSSSCWLGQTVVYSRRNQTANCTDARGEQRVSVTSCLCTIEDYQCDFGFEPNNKDGQLTCSISGTLPPSPPAVCIGTYEKTQGFRLVPGDQCHDGLDKKPQVLTCPPPAADNKRSSKGWVAVVVILVILVVVGLAGFLVYRDPTLKEKLTSLFSRRRYNRVGRIRSSSLAHEEDFGIQDDLLEEGEDDAKVLHDNDISRASSVNRSDEFFNRRDDS